MRVLTYLGFLSDIREAATVAEVDRIARRFDRRGVAERTHPGRDALVREQLAARRGVLAARVDARLPP
jgi:hypothetical protein